VDEDRYQNFLKHVGANVRNVRLSKGYTMEQLANEANIETRQLGRIERGEINTTIVSLKRLANCLKVKVQGFFVNEPD
jgi:transcriptional regulator with XRE-family HTH domain